MSAAKMWMGSVLLTTVLACTVGEGPGEARPVPPDEPPIEEEAPEVDPGPPGAEAEADRRATELATEASLAYEAGRLDEAWNLATRVLTEHVGTTAVDAARWVAARTAFSLERYEDAEELAEAHASALPGGSMAAEEARGLAELARDALRPPDGPPAMIGAIVPRSGSRALVRYGDWVLEGIRLAVRQVEAEQGRRVELVVADGGGGTRTRDAVMELERRGVTAIIGPMLAHQVPEASGARVNQDLVMVSPTNPAPPLMWPELYSVNTGDTRGAQELGRFAAEAGFRQAAMLYPRVAEYERKAQAFAVEFEALGGRVRAAVPYDSGTTTFEPHMQRILDAVAPAPLYPDTMAADPITGDPVFRLPADTALGAAAGPQEPFALFVAAPDADVRQIAPQIAFYSLDAAGAQVLGDEGWTGAAVRRVVPVQDLQGVIAASHFPPGRNQGVADQEFVQLYEDTYRRSLENQLPALGFDAANLVLQALPNRMMTPGAVARRFRLLTGIRGATGILSVRANRVVRTPFTVVIRDGQLEPAPQPWEYTLPVPIQPAPGPDGQGGGRR